MKHRFIHGWVAQQQKAYHQRTRGIMTPEERKELEAEATKAMAEIERKAAQKAWDQGFEAGWAECSDPGAFVNDLWDAKTPNPYGLTAEHRAEAFGGESRGE